MLVPPPTPSWGRTVEYCSLHKRPTVFGSRSIAASAVPLPHRSRAVQRLEMLVTLMLARERRAAADAADSADVGGTPFTAALAVLPSGVLEMVAEAAAALGHADA